MKTQLRQIAHARSGDKGDDANIGLIALKPQDYLILVREVTVERVKKHFAGICRGEVERYELPNLHALNFVLHHALDGGGLVSLRMDNQGKTLVPRLLRMAIAVPQVPLRNAGWSCADHTEPSGQAKCPGWRHCCRIEGGVQRVVCRRRVPRGAAHRSGNGFLFWR